MRRNKGVITINLRQVIGVVENANEIYTAFYDIQIGETVYMSYGSITGKRDKALTSIAAILLRHSGAICLPL